MLQLENLVFVILAICLIVCAVFWYQVTHVQLPQRPPTPVATQRPPADDLLPMIPAIGELPRPEPPNLEDAFRIPWREKKPTVGPVVEETPPPPLTTIFWSPTAARAIIDGEILGSGEKDRRSRFQVEMIRPKYVQILRFEDNKLIWLTLNPDPNDEAVGPIVQQ